MTITPTTKIDQEIGYVSPLFSEDEMSFIPQLNAPSGK